MRNIYVRFALASVLPFVALGIFLASDYRAAIEHRAAEVYGSSAETMFDLMADALLTGSDFSAPLAPDRIALLDEILSKVASNEKVKVRVLDIRGRVQYSTDHAEIGAVLPVDRQVRAAASGSLTTRFSDGGPGSIIENGTRQVEIFLPVHLAQGSDVFGVIEAAGIDQTLAIRIDGDVRRVRVSLAMGLAVLWLTLIPIVVSVSRRLRRHVRENRDLALHDTLTGLANRNLLEDRLAHEIAVALRTGDLVGLLLIDLDEFKLVNDTLGHRKGDELLRQVAATFETTVRRSDTVARLGGDEFAIIVPRAATIEEITEVAERITESLAGTFCIEEIDVGVEASIGIAVLPFHGIDGEELLQRADIAMYAAKESGLDHLLYSADIDSHSPTRLALAADLRRALNDDDGQLVVHFQPEVSTETGCVEVMEALARWNHPRLAELGPMEFIPVAEHSGLIHRLTAHVLDLALAESRRWSGHGIDVVVAVNLSPRDLRDLELLDVVKDALARHQVPADRLELEVTETGVIAHPEVAVELLSELRELGVAIALDDFGTGFSSLTYLKRLAPDRLKIDRGFVDTMINQHTDASIVRSVVELAHSLGMGVTAEGVETVEHLRKLAELDCDLAQGYYFARPLAPDDALDWLRLHAPVVVGSAHLID